MSPADRDPAVRWLDFARDDLAYARLPLPEGASCNIACFHAQQAVEKALKAILTSRQVEFERSHSIGFLRRLLPADLDCPNSVEDAIALTRFAVVARYPGDYEEISAAQYRDALRMAADIVAWAEGIVGYPPGVPHAA